MYDTYMITINVTSTKWQDFTLMMYVAVSANVVGLVSTTNDNQSIGMLLLTHWGRVTHICVGNLTIIGPDNGLSPGRRQDIIWTNAGILLIGHWGTNFSEILIGIHTFSFKKIHLQMSSAKWRPFCLGLNMLRQDIYLESHKQQTNSSSRWL